LHDLWDLVLPLAQRRVLKQSVSLVSVYACMVGPFTRC